MGAGVRVGEGTDIESFSWPAMRTWILEGERKRKVKEKKRNAGSNESLGKVPRGGFTPPLPHRASRR